MEPVHPIQITGMFSYFTEWSSRYYLTAYMNNMHSFKLKPNSALDCIVNDVLYVLYFMQ
jgi:hypothetical protein